MAVFLTAKLF